MRAPTTIRRSPLRFNMTPMIDVVFLLIIFFLVSSHLAQQETQVELALPISLTSVEPQATSAPRVTINVLPDGQVLLGAAAVAPDELARRLAVERGRAGENLEVRIRGDRAVAYRFVEPILLACARSGVWNVTFAVIKDEG